MWMSDNPYRTPRTEAESLSATEFWNPLTRMIAWILLWLAVILLWGLAARFQVFVPGLLVGLALLVIVGPMVATAGSAPEVDELLAEGLDSSVAESDASSAGRLHGDE